MEFPAEYLVHWPIKLQEFVDNILKSLDHNYYYYRLCFQGIEPGSCLLWKLF